MFDVLSNEKTVQTLVKEHAELSDKIRKAIKSFINEIKSIIARLSENWDEVKALKDDVETLERIRAVFDSVMKKIDESNKNTADVGGEGKYSIIDSITDDNGNTYHDVVFLDSDISKRLNSGRWRQIFLEHVYKNLIKKSIIVLDEKGNQEQIVFAKEKERVTKDGANNSHSVIGKLETKKDHNSRLVIVQADEVASVSKYENKNNEHTHQWLDENGWEFRKSFVITKNGDIFSVTLNIAKTRDGRNILYDINKIYKVGHGDVTADVIDKKGSHINPDSTERSVSQTAPSVNSQHRKRNKKNQINHRISAKKKIANWVKMLTPIRKMI